MTPFGLTPAGPVRKPAPEIRAAIISRLKNLPGYSRIRTTTGSAWGNVIDAIVAEISENWEGWEQSMHAFSSDSAEDQALDALMTLVAKSRVLATYGSVDLTLWSTHSSAVPVAAGNQAQQSETNALWETTLDAVIPAATRAVTGIVLGAIAWQGDNTVRYSVPAGLSLASMQAGDLLNVTGAAVTGNNGTFLVTDVDDAAHWVEVENPQRNDNTGDETSSPGTGILTDAHTTVLAQAVLKGEISAPAQSVDLINTPVSNWRGVVNLTDGVAGRNTEENNEFRIRAKQELSVAQGGPVEAVKAQLRKLPGVSYVSGYSVRDPLDPDYGYHFTIVGGLDADIARCLGTYIAGGVPTKGTSSAPFTDPEGVVEPMFFSRVDIVYLWLILNLTVNPTVWSSPALIAEYKARVVAALLKLNDVFEHGHAVLNLELLTAVGGAKIPGLLGAEILQGISDPPTTSADTVIAPDEVAHLVEAQIEVNS